MPQRGLPAETVAISAETVAIPPPVVAEPAPPAPPTPAAVEAASPVAPAPARPAAGKLPPKRPSRLMAGIAAAAGVAVLLAVGFVVAPKFKRAPAAAPVSGEPAPAAPVAAPVAPPPNSTVRVLADVEAGKVALDDNPPGDLQDGQISLDNLAPGKHSLKISAAHEQATIALEAVPGAPPNVESVAAKEVIAVTVTSMGGRAKVQSSAGSAKVSVDGKAVGETGAAGLELNDLAPGNHELTVGEGKDLRSMVVGIGPAPMLTVFLKSDRNAGALVLVTGEDGVHVFLDGKEYRKQTERGQLRINNLPVKEYAVRVAKDGFLEEPEQRAPVRKGEESKLEFHLRPLPRVASLVISGAIPGAVVLLDGNPIGTVQDDGSFRQSSVSPGEHALELRKDAYRPKKIEKRFEAGASVDLAAADVAMEKIPATLRLRVTPPDARVTISRAGEAPRAVGDTTLTVADGTYTLAARAPNYADKSVTVTVSAGETKAVDLVLTSTASAVKVLGMADWDEPAGWVEEAGWFVRKGGNFVGYKPSQITGTFVFTLDLRKGKRLQWVVARVDAKNYLLFQMDKKFFYRAQVVDGKEKELNKTPYAAPKGSALTIEMGVAVGNITHKLWDGSKWGVLDSWTEADRQFGNGKFGFLIPGGDTVALSNFGFTPK